MIDKPLALSLKLKGWTYKKIGELFNVSKQRIEQAIGDQLPERKRYKCTRLTNSERKAMDILKKKGFKVEPMSFHDEYDLRVNDLRVEVKSVSEGKKAVIVNNRKSDLYFFFIGNDYFLIPTHLLPDFITIANNFSTQRTSERKKMFDKYKNPRKSILTPIIEGVY